MMNDGRQLGGWASIFLYLERNSAVVRNILMVLGRIIEQKMGSVTCRNDQSA